MSAVRTLRDLAGEARQRGIEEITPRDAWQWLEKGPEEAPIVIDVREPDERAAGRLPGAYALPRGVLERDVAKRLFEGEVGEADRKRPLLCYCGGGSRSLLAAAALQDMGFARPVSLQGGFDGWREAGFPVEGEP